MEIKTAIMFIALILSFASIYYVRRFWLLSNRPIITAEVVKNSDGAGIILFDLVVYNSGNRPATNIKINADKEEINKILSDSISQDKKNEVIDMFLTSNKISLLLNGKEAKTAFFSFCNYKDKNANILKYESELPIKISYQDIDKRNYYSNISLYIRDKEGFGGSVWNNT